MKCHWSFTATTLVAAVGFIFAVISAFARTKEGRRFASLSLMSNIAIMTVILSPLGIGLCANTEMTCHQTAWIVWALCLIALIVALMMFVLADPKKATLPKAKL